MATTWLREHVCLRADQAVTAALDKHVNKAPLKPDREKEMDRHFDELKTRDGLADK